MMKNGAKVISILGALISVIFEVFSFAGYWFNMDLSSWIANIPGIGRMAYALLYTIAWPWGKVMFPLLFLYLLVWNAALAQREGWARIVGVALSSFSLVYLLAFALILVPVWSTIGVYHWIVVFVWLILVGFLSYELIWLLEPRADKLFAYKYMDYKPPKPVGLPIGEIVEEKPGWRDKPVEETDTKTGRVNNPPKGMPSLGRFYNKDLNLDLRVYKEVSSIGRSPDNDVVIGDPTVSAKHATLTYKDGRFILRDDKSSNGTYVNGHEISEAAISDGDVVKFGAITLTFQLPRRKGAGSSPSKSPAAIAWLVSDEKQAFPILAGKNTIGRQNDNDIVIDEVTVSRHHASLVFEKGIFTIEDLGSSNGTFVNGERVKPGKNRINEGSRLRFGDVEFVLQKTKVAAERVEESDEKSKENEIKPQLKDAPVYTRAFLVDSNGRKIDLSEGVIKIGRSLTNDIVVDDASVSNYHAEVTRENGRYLLRDLDSTNGTFVNGSKIDVCYLKSGDLIQFGETKYIFHGEINS